MSRFNVRAEGLMVTLYGYQLEGSDEPWHWFSSRLQRDTELHYFVGGVDHEKKRGQFSIEAIVGMEVFQPRAMRGS